MFRFSTSVWSKRNEKRTPSQQAEQDCDIDTWSIHSSAVRKNVFLMFESRLSHLFFFFLLLVRMSNHENNKGGKEFFVRFLVSHLLGENNHGRTETLCVYTILLTLMARAVLLISAIAQDHLPLFSLSFCLHDTKHLFNDLFFFFFLFYVWAKQIATNVWWESLQ